MFSYVVKGIKIKTTAKFPASRRLRFEDTKGIQPCHPKCSRKVSELSRNGPPPPSSPLDILKDDEMLAGAGWSEAFRRNSTEV